MENADAFVESLESRRLWSRLSDVGGELVEGEPGEWSRMTGCVSSAHLLSSACAVDAASVVISAYLASDAGVDVSVEDAWNPIACLATASVIPSTLLALSPVLTHR